MPAQRRPRTSCCAPSRGRSGRSGRPAASSAWTANRIMISGPTDERDRRAPGRAAPARIRSGTTPTFPCQSRPAASTVTSHLEVEPGPPGVELVGEEQVGRRARAVQQDDPAVVAPGARAPGRSRAAAAPARCRPRRSPRRRPRPLAPASSCRTGRGRPTGRPARSAHSACVTAPDVADRVQHRAGPRRVAADRDRHLADAEHVQHVELSGLEAERPRRLELQRRPCRATPPGSRSPSQGGDRSTGGRAAGLSAACA